LQLNKLNNIPRIAASLALAFLVALSAGCDDSSGPEIPPTPTGIKVSATTVAPGDTVRVTGTDFLAETDKNTVRFNNAFGEAVPYSGTTTRLDVVVPQNALTGPISVFVEENPTPGIGPSVTVPRGVGDVYVIQAGSFELPVPLPTSRYLVVPHATSGNYTARLPYTLTGSDAPPEATPPGVVSAAEEPGIRYRFEAHLREDWARNLRHVPGAKMRPDQPAPAAAQQTRQFYVFDDPDASTVDARNYTRVTAELRYDSQWCSIYTDLDTLASGNLAWAQIKNFGETFDNTIRPTNTRFFGVESDVDGNGKVIILVSPVVNRMTLRIERSFIGGFFNQVDLFRPNQGVPAGTTNFSEIFYVLAADPGGFWSHEHSTAFVAQENIKTIAHEYEHLISFSQRKFNFGSVYQDTWLEEGMAHMAEDLNAINSSNVKRANIFLADPGEVSLENARPGVGPRGASYLFLRWLADRFGEEILEDIVKSKCTGRSCIGSVTGEDFYQTVADWLATLYLSGRGIASSKYNYRSIDLDDFMSLPVSIRDADGNAAAGTVVRSGGDHYLFRNLTTSTNLFTLSPIQPGRLRVVIVQTQ